MCFLVVSGADEGGNLGQQRVYLIRLLESDDGPACEFALWREGGAHQ